MIDYKKVKLTVKTPKGKAKGTCNVMKKPFTAGIGKLLHSEVTSDTEFVYIIGINSKKLDKRRKRLAKAIGGFEGITKMKLQQSLDNYYRYYKDINKSVGSKWKFTKMKLLTFYKGFKLDELYNDLKKVETKEQMLEHLRVDDDQEIKNLISSSLVTQELLED